MKHTLWLLTLTLLLHATSSMAIPMLSADGSSLTGVDVGGTLYDVMFGNGVLGTVYAGVTFDAARETEANAVSAALVDALNFLDTPYDDIAGCDVNGRGVCNLMNPDELDAGSYVDNNVAFTDLNVMIGEDWLMDGHGVSLPATSDTASNPQFTLVTYQQAAPAPAPAPATVALFGLALAGLGYSRRKRQAHR